MTKRFPHLPVALFLTGFCILVIEVLLALKLPKIPAELDANRFYRLHTTPSIEQSIVQWQVHGILNRDISDKSVFIVGDSACLMGVNPTAIEKTTGIKSLNAGTLGWISSDGYKEILDLYLERHPAPRLVIFYSSLYPFQITKGEIERTGFLRRLRDWTGGSEKSAVNWLPSYRLRYLVPQALSKKLFSQSYLTSSRGVYPSDEEVRKILEGSSGFFPEFRQIDVAQENFSTQLTMEGLPALERLCSYVESRGLPMLIMLNPVPEAFRGKETEEMFATIEARLKELAATRQNIFVHSPLLRYYPNDYFATLTHLGAPGVVQNSKEVGQAILALTKAQALPKRS